MIVKRNGNLEEFDPEKIKKAVTSSAERVMVDLTDEKEIDQFERLLAMLEDLDDVQDVYHNVNWEAEEE